MRQQQPAQPQPLQQPLQQQLPPPPPNPPTMTNTQPPFAMSDREWREALQAQQEYEWQLQVQQQISVVQEQQRKEQDAQREAQRHSQDEDMLDERSFYDLGGSRRNTQARLSSNPIRLSPVHSYSDSMIPTHQERRRTSAPAIPPALPPKLSPEEEFYNSANVNLSTNKLAQYTPDSETPLSPEIRRLEDPPKPRSFSVDALSTNSYPVPTPISAARKPKEPTPFSVITHRFPNWYIDGTPLPENEEDEGSHGPLAKRRRTLSEAEKDDEQYWGVFYNGSGQWSMMWNRLLDGIYDYYYRMNCKDKAGLDPQTMGQMWEDMGYSVEENLYESQLRLAQSLFHPDPEDFISSLLSNYYRLLDLPHFLEQPPIQPPPSFLPKCVNPEPPVPIPQLTREGFKLYFVHQTLLDPTVMHDRFNKLLKNRPTGIVDPETSLLFVRRETGGPIVPRKSFPSQEDGAIEEVEERVRSWMRSWVKGEVEGWVGSNPPGPPEGMI
ncbi:hypothetical protein ABW20_dc0108511 [Dactylellina cionopaga]|nr:hypothetical protein ABW20_dc0108511 [Dactylellina cionopaga]